MTRTYHTPAVHYAAAALRRGPLVKHGRLWRFRQRNFCNTTIGKLIQRGEATREGNHIIGRNNG